MKSVCAMIWRLFAVLVIVGASAASAADLPSALVEPYLRIHTALAADKFDGVKADAAAVTAAAGKIGSSAEKIQGASKRLEAAADLKTARTAFGELSEAVLAYANNTKSSLGADVHEVFCPMVQKPWLQKGRTTQNPYYGKDMLGCGELKR